MGHGALMCASHINCPELLAVRLTLKHFLPLLRGHHVLIKTDNSTVVAYVNRQGGLRSLRLHMLAHKLIVWGSTHFLSLRATHVPGALNCCADLLSRRKCSLCGVETPSSCGQAGWSWLTPQMVDCQSTICGPFCISGERPVYPVLLLT